MSDLKFPEWSLERPAHLKRIAELEALLREVMVCLQGVPSAREAQDYAQVIKNALNG